jgi:hypothetical protein
MSYSFQRAPYVMRRWCCAGMRMPDAVVVASIAGLYFR